MAADVRFRPPEPQDAERVAAGLRAIDLLECSAFGLSAERALAVSLENAIHAWVATVDGEPEAIFGVGAISLLSGIGRPWMLATPRARLERRAFLTQARTHLGAIEATFPRLENYIHQQNHTSRRWLARLGFEIEPEPVHIGGQEMLRFTKGF